MFCGDVTMDDAEGCPDRRARSSCAACSPRDVVHDGGDDADGDGGSRSRAVLMSEESEMPSTYSMMMGASRIRLDDVERGHDVRMSDTCGGKLSFVDEHHSERWVRFAGYGCMSDGLPSRKAGAPFWRPRVDGCHATRRKLPQGS